ncbi:MAG: uroporphyrinogen decarboxylase family protein [Akkermansiaceae bacterium]|nr:uroporphyrinogen decarboxylase family protein [Akkermansiaceae bacterium]MCF7731560.1 uroporphyrinogen decarboxylase family protein [Akkermansiaceae bacterium]
MNSKEIIAATLSGQRAPRIPNGMLAVHSCAGPAGYSLQRYTTDPVAMADSVIRYHERFKPDAVWLSADTWISAEAMGARVGSTGEDQPCGGYGAPLVSSAADIDRIPPPDVSSQGRYPLMLDALRRIVDAVGAETHVVACFDQYPFSLAAALMGINEIMLAVDDDPAFVQALLDRCTEFGLAYGTALAAAGAHSLSGGDSPAGLLGPERYEEIALPAERALLEKLRPAAGIPVSLHICGNATPILRLMATTGADILELDHAVDLTTACRIVGPEIALWGNLNPVAVLANGTPEMVREASLAAMAAARSENHSRFVLSSGCTLAVGTPAANLDALIQASLESA